MSSSTTATAEAAPLDEGATEMTKTSWLSAGLAAGLGCLLLAAAPVAAQEPAASGVRPRGTATTSHPTLPPPTRTLDVVGAAACCRVGVSTFVPWAMNAKGGDLIGFEIDLAKRLADDLGVRRSSCRPRSRACSTTCWPTGSTSSSRGCPSRPPAPSSPTSRSRSGSPTSASSPAARRRPASAPPPGFDRPEVTIAVRAGAIGEQIARRSFPKATIQPFEDVDVALEALLTGKVTAGVA